MRTLDRRRAARRGFSLVEVLIGLVMLGSLFGSLLVVVSQGTNAARTGMERQSIESLARRTLDRVAHELASAGVTTLSPNPSAPFGSDHLTFQCISGYEGGAVQWQTPASFSLELEEGELDDGVDNNSNGLADERVLVYTRDPNGAAERTLLAHHVCELLEGETTNGNDDNGNGLKDEAGLSFQRVGGTLCVRLSLEERDLRGGVSVRTVQTSVRLRN